MRKSTAYTLKVLIEMDAALGGRGLFVPTFARKHRVDRHLVYRYRDALEALGQRIKKVRRRFFERGGLTGRWYVEGWDAWKYAPGVVPLFNREHPLHPSRRGQ